ncbi:unnamed protein product [Rotaria sp. Silwood1]|nr:unnamed protein product [Rotaria sp. Silwood1]
MALGPPVSTTAFVVVYNPSQYIQSITNGQVAERIEALKHMFECITHSDIDLITLGSIWLCITGLLTNEEQQGSMNSEIRLCAFKCILELTKIELIRNHLAKAQWHSISVISVLCGIIVERLETPINNDIDPLSTLLFVLTQTLIDVHQYRSKTQHHVQLSNDDIIHRKCFLNRIQQLPLCWLTILHQVLMKRQNVNIILINFQQFLRSLNDKNYSCALNLFSMTVWKMMDEIMKICYRYLIVDQKSTTTTRALYDDCLNMFEDFANKLCCLPHTMVTHLFDIKRLTSISRTPLREQLIKQSCTKLLHLIRPNNPEWSVALKELTEHIILNSKEAVTTRIDVLTTVFDKYLWFKMTDQVTIIGQIILETLENLIYIDLNSISENEFLSKHALMKQNAIKSIFEYFLSDHSIDSNIANHCYKILKEVTIIGQIILETLENLIYIDLNSITENEFLSKHALMKQNAIKSIFEYFLLDHSIDSNIANHCYKILKEIYEQDLANISSIESIHRPLIEYILEQMYLHFENNLTYTRLTSFNHCSMILNFFIKQFFSNYSKIVSCIQTKIRILIWQLLLNIRIRSSDSRIGMYLIKMETIVYGTYRTNGDHKTNENENFLDLHDYLSNMVDWFKCVRYCIVQDGP